MSRLAFWGDKQIKDMDVQHLQNTLRLLRQYAKERNNGRNNYGFDSILFTRPLHEWYADMSRELRRRYKVRTTGQTR